MDCAELTACVLRVGYSGRVLHILLCTSAVLFRYTCSEVDLVTFCQRLKDPVRCVVSTRTSVGARRFVSISGKNTYTDTCSCTLYF